MGRFEREPFNDFCLADRTHRLCLGSFPWLREGWRRWERDDYTINVIATGKLTLANDDNGGAVARISLPAQEMLIAAQ